MPAPTRISFVRHGEVENPNGVFYGRLPGFGLTAKGRRQARAAAESLRDQQIAALYSSPLLRARQTAEAILDALPGTPLFISPHLNEVHCPYDGQAHSVLDAIGWDIYASTEPPYEQPGDLLARTTRLVADIRRQYAGQHVVATTHGDVIAFLLLWLADRAVTAQNRRGIAELGIPGGYPAHASITTLTYRTTHVHERPPFEYAVPR